MSAGPAAHVRLEDAVRVKAPDGSRVSILAASARGSMAHFALAPGQVSIAVRHRTVEELWFIVAGRGRMWRSGGGGEDMVELSAGQSLAIPAGIAFQFRNDGEDTLEAVGVTMPPWPGMDEAETVAGAWTPRAGCEWS